MNPTGKAAREVIRFLDELRKIGKLTDGVQLENGGRLQVSILDRTQQLPPGLDGNVKDNHILQVALRLKETKKSVLLVTKDADLRIKADVLGQQSADYVPGYENLEGGIYTGAREIQTDNARIDHFYKARKMDLAEFLKAHPQTVDPSENEYLSIKGPSKSALARISLDRGEVDLLHLPDEKIFGILPRNREQRFAFHALLDPSVQIITLSGRAGTGKTLMAIACGLEQVTHEMRYRKMLIARPTVPMGRDLGFLPGELGEKLDPWMQPVYDNLELLLGDSQKGESDREKRHTTGADYLMNSGLLSVEPLSYIRGRSIPRQFIIIDETQNLSPHETKTIITRVGEGTKIVFTGDYYQIDHPYLNFYTNGLTFLIERFRNQKLAAHINLLKGERSELAELASQLLE